MKNAIIIFLCLCSLTVHAQSSNSYEVKKTILDFFEAFHNQDSVRLKSLAKDGIIMQTVSKDQNGSTLLKTTDFNRFIKSIVSIPKENTFEEKILEFSIQIDGNMAHAWTPYEFWFNGKFSHCGVNSFQLIKEGEEWKIIYLVDTRRKENCNKA